VTPAVARYKGGPSSRAQISGRLAHDADSYERHRLQYWPLFLHDTGAHVGCCGVAPHLTDGPAYQFGFHLRPAHWRRGYVREAAPVTIADAFDSRGAAVLYAGHHPDYEVSPRALVALGFRHTHDEFYAPPGVVERCYRLAPRDRRWRRRSRAALSRAAVRG
jgi:[ribosomal protein S5]-alanine N-acetyltransferase